MAPCGMNICKNTLQKCYLLPSHPPSHSLSLPTPPLLPPQCLEPPPPPASSPSTGARGHRGRRRPLESEPHRVEDLELSEVLQPIDLEVWIRAAQPRALRVAELPAAVVLDSCGWVDLQAAAACGVARAAGRAAAGGAAGGSGAGPRPAQRNKAGGAACGAEARPQAGGAESRRSETSAVEQILRVKATVRPRIAAAT